VKEFMSSVIGLEDFCSEGEDSALDFIFSSACISAASVSEAETLSTEQEPSGDVSEIEACNGYSFSVFQNKKLGIAHQLWPAASRLCNFFQRNPHLIDHHKNSTVIELGAGIGLCGMTLSAMGAKSVTLTDLAEAVPTMERNVSLNTSKFSGEVKVEVLRWGVREDLCAILNGMVDAPLIIASDCVYWECLYQPLFETLSTLTSFGCDVYIAHVKRWKKDGKFFSMCKKSMEVKILEENIEHISELNSMSGRIRREVSRIYKISPKASV
jgi:predicted nicotinamide N-methyase